MFQAISPRIPAMKQMNLIRSILVGILLLSAPFLFAQKRWVGGNGSWDNALNWLPAAVPDSTDQVILDNSFQPAAYVVDLPDHAVIVNGLTIVPAAGRQIELRLPATSVVSPAFTTRATGDAIVIKSGGVLRNLSGLGSGQSIQLSGLLRIENGGAYIHQTRSAHATELVARLSTAAGTENGQFEFDVPGGSYPVSLSNRIYGKLVFSSRASGGTQTYNASGTSPLLVRGDLVISDGVILNLDFTKDCTVMGNYVQEGGIFNVANQPAANKINLQGDVNQLAAGIITETSTGLPLLEFNGTRRQSVSLAGNMLNQLTLRVNNPAGVSLLHSLTIPYLLQLQQGNLFTSHTSLLNVPDDSRITGASAQSFVDGPIKKTGDEAFEFPVGRQTDYAPVAISAGTAVTDGFIATYHHGNPQIVYGAALESSIHHLSALEYWSIEQTAGSSRKITLSVGTYSHATAISKLVVSRWDAGQSSWKNEGNSAWTGLSTGTLTSNPITGYGAFTLGSTVKDQNPLPVVVAQNKDPVSSHSEQTSFSIKQVRRAGNDLVVTVSSGQKQRLQVVVTDMGGRIVYTAKHEVIEGTSSTRCGIPALAKGIHFIQVSGERGQVRTCKLYLE